ncbi:MAG TPA: TIGR03087 family PEP-CTERM/XrtA system glycosyltransferase, partial [Vicinamibacterales bacterium]|nr:TIGR03087 family PEP-CTERM/XrtA system glycosyltransferase [Vicinamibacterales bacterium]
MNVLFLTHRLPYAPNRGDRIRAYHIIRTLRKCGHLVDLVSLVHDQDESSHANSMRSLVDSLHIAPVHPVKKWLGAVRNLASGAPLTHALLDSPRLRPAIQAVLRVRRPDVVLAYCSSMARVALEPPLSGFPVVIDLVDVDSLKWRSLASKTMIPKRLIFEREGTLLSRFEAHAGHSAFATVVINEREGSAFETIAPGAIVRVVPNGVDFEYWRSPGESSRAADVAFCGVMNYAPNEEGAIWLANNVWPLVVKRRPEARLLLVGAYPTARIKRLATQSGRIEVTGEVSDVRPFLWNSAVGVAPLHTARGIQNKVLEAVAAGLPVVVTPVVADGLPNEVLPACVVAGDATGFADAIVDRLAL